MTVCIAALAEDGKKAVLVADKMLTVQGTFPYTLDGSGDKIFKINDNVHAMWCGGYVDATNILNKLKTSMGSAVLSVYETAEKLREAHLEYLQEVLIRENIIGRGIPSLADFYGNASIMLTEDSRKSIENALANFWLNSNTQFIVCGKDADGLYKIFILPINPRNMILFGAEGYTQIGSGSFHAQYSMIHSNYKTSLSVDKVQKLALGAKKKAEKAPDVGKEEDIVILQ